MWVTEIRPKEYDYVESTESHKKGLFVNRIALIYFSSLFISCICNNI